MKLETRHILNIATFAMFLLMQLLMAQTCSTYGKIDFLTKSEQEQIQNLDGWIKYNSSELGILHYRGGLKSFGSGDMKQAYSHFTRSAGMLPDWDLPLLYLAIVHPLYDNNQQAELEALLKALKINSKNPKTQLMAGSVCYQLENFMQAESFFKEAIKQKSNYQDAHFRLAELFYSSKRYEEAISEYKFLLSQQSQSAFIHVRLVDLYEKTDLFWQAEKQLKWLIALQQNPGWVYIKLAQFYERQGQVKKAKEIYLIADDAYKKESKKMRPLLPSRK